MFPTYLLKKYACMGRLGAHVHGTHIFMVSPFIRKQHSPLNKTTLCQYF